MRILESDSLRTEMSRVSKSGGVGVPDSESFESRQLEMESVFPRFSMLSKTANFSHRTDHYCSAVGQNLDVKRIKFHWKSDWRTGAVQTQLLWEIEEL
jgi:hypothetical protein